MAKPTEGNIKGAQTHAEGQHHGDKTYAANKARINNEGVEPTVNNDSSAGLREANDPNAHGKQSKHSPDGEREFAAGVNTGKHHLFEDREQHDEADKNSDRNRADRVHSPIEKGHTDDGK